MRTSVLALAFSTVLIVCGSVQSGQNEASCDPQGAALAQARARVLHQRPRNVPDDALQRLFAALICHGRSDGDLRKLAGQNLLRVMRQVETVAKRLQWETPPSSATIDELDNEAGDAKTEAGSARK